MRTILKQILVPFASAIVGGTIVLGATKFHSDSQLKIEDKHFHNRFNNPSVEDFYKDIFKKQNEVFRQFYPKDDPIDSWFPNKIGESPINDILKREDDNSVYYDIKVDDIQSTAINTKVENGYITITGTTEKKRFYKSTFNRTFPIPEQVDPNKMEMVSEKDKITLKFPKIKA